MTSPVNGANAVEDLTTLLDQLTGAPPAPQVEEPWPEMTGPAPAEDVIEPAFRDLDAFMREYLTQVVERRVVAGPKAGVYWCSSWWEHPEAISRLYALWREWEKARVEDTMSMWWIHHLDPHLAALTAEYGPFCKCDPDIHKPVETLPADRAPAEVLAQLPEG